MRSIYWDALVTDDNETQKSQPNTFTGRRVFMNLQTSAKKLYKSVSEICNSACHKTRRGTGFNKRMVEYVVYEYPSTKYSYP
jgi:hypothetical protein